MPCQNMFSQNTFCSLRKGAFQCKTRKQCVPNSFRGVVPLKRITISLTHHPCTCMWVHMRLKGRCFAFAIRGRTLHTSAKCAKCAYVHGQACRMQPTFAQEQHEYIWHCATHSRHMWTRLWAVGGCTRRSRMRIRCTFRAHVRIQCVCEGEVGGQVRGSSGPVGGQ